MSICGWRSSCAAFALLPTVLLTASLLPQVARAGSARIAEVEPGATPFIAYVGATYAGTLASVSYSILPVSGSFTRALQASYSANYLTSHNDFVPGSSAVVIPVFGLYAGTRNTVTINYTFTDGTVSTSMITIATPSYTDPCPSINQRTFIQERQSTSNLNFDYYALKDYCSTNSPALFDTDNNIRWVGNAGDTAQDTAFFNNAFYFSNGNTGINRIDITNGQVTTVADYASIGVTATNQHNIDPGRVGLIVEVDTTAQLEAAAIEINPATGAVLNTWDFGAIIAATMTAGGDTPGKFVLGTTADWFHNNATAYNPADNTLIVSSRENFVMAVDYDAPASGQRKIHWILGDTTKAWHSYPSLAKYTLKLANNSTLPPIGQHAVSIDHQGNLLLFDDGLGSLTLTPTGATRSYSAARAYQINTTTMTATSTYTYTAASGGVPLFSPICGSVYDVDGNYLVDFATTNPAATAAAQSNQNPTAIVNTLLNGSVTSAILVGVNNAEQIEFVQQLPDTTPCAPGWNAVPFASNVFTFK